MDNNLFKSTMKYFRSFSLSSTLQSINYYVDIYNDDVPFLLPLYAKDDSTLPLREDLETFFEETKATDFFESNHNEYLEIFFSEDFSSNIWNYLDKMENYVNNKEFIAEGKPITYDILISEYLTHLRASKFVENKGENVNIFIALSPYTFSNGTLEFSKDQVIETIIHEALHYYINPEVEKKAEWIAKKSKDYGFNAKDFGGKVYGEMPWSRIIDENIVRVVEAAIYSDIYGDEERAIKQILDKEIGSGEMKFLMEFYKIFQEYNHIRIRNKVSMKIFHF